MKVAVIEPLFTPLNKKDVYCILPQMLRAFGHPPSSLIIDKAGAVLGVHLRLWAEEMGLPYELAKMSPYLDNMAESIVGHLDAVERADAVVAFWTYPDSVVAKAVSEMCQKCGKPYVCFYAW